MEIGVSIIICTFNGQHRLKETLAHARNQLTSYPYEILVVNNNSTDSTSVWVESYISKSDSHLPIRLLEEERQGLSLARRKGIEAANFPFILFCDDDNWLNEDFIQRGADILSANSKIGVLGSFGIPKIDGSRPEWFDYFGHSYAVGSLGKSSGLQPKGSYHYGAACFFRKEALVKLNSIGFESLLIDRKGQNLSSGGDVELCLVVQLLGFDLYYDENLRFYHYIESYRLSWNYYVRLKKGISASFPLLESYNFKEYSSVREFRQHLWEMNITVLKGIIKSSIYSGRKNQVAWASTTSKFSSFFQNYRKTIDAYVKNQCLFNV